MARPASCGSPTRSTRAPDHLRRGAV